MQWSVSVFVGKNRVLKQLFVFRSFQHFRFKLTFSVSSERFGVLGSGHYKKNLFFDDQHEPEGHKHR